MQKKELSRDKIGTWDTCYPLLRRKAFNRRATVTPEREEKVGGVGVETDTKEKHKQTLNPNVAFLDRSFIISTIK